MAAGPGHEMPPTSADDAVPEQGSRPDAGSGAGRLRAADADRERAVDVLKTGFAEGRLSKDEFDERVTRAYASRTYGDLAALTAGLPADPPGAPPPAAGPPHAAVRWRIRTNGETVAALLRGLPARITSVIADALYVRREMEQTGEWGSSIAGACIVVGSVGIAWLAIAISVLAATAGSG